MKTLVVYSSLTGNTKSVAEAIAQVCPEPCICSVKDECDPKEYDLVVIGYWVDRGMPDKTCQKFMQTVSGMKVGLFGTLGAYPDSDHALGCKAGAEKIMTDNGNEVFAHFLCQGKINPKVLESMAKRAPHKHPMTEERRARIEEAKKHPNEIDFTEAQKVFRESIDKL